jgi:ATP-dependent protease ClpP protease subunit
LSKQKINRFWEFRPGNAAENEPPELIIYDRIASTTWWDDAVTPKQFGKELAALGDVPEIVVRINSPGGDVFAAVAIYTRLKDHGAKITVKIDGWACSAATIVAMAGDTIMIPAAGAFMIHNPAIGIMGFFMAEELTKYAEELDVVKNSIINAYAGRGMSKDELSDLMTEETWYTGEEAVEAGFCDEIMFEEVNTETDNAGRIVVNSVPFDIGDRSKIPESLFNRPGRRVGGFANTNTEEKQKDGEEMEIKNLEELKAAYPELTRQIAEAAVAEERQRIKDIESVALDGYESIVQAAKFEKPAPAADVAMQIIAAQKKQGAAYLAGRDADARDSGADDVKSQGSEGAADGGENPYMAAIDKVLPKKV